MEKDLSRREFVCQSAGAIGGLGALASARSTAAGVETATRTRGDDRAKRPNILFIMTDQQRYDCVGANGNKIIQTPNLDRLAAGAANFSRAYIQAPVCVPSRASFFNGRYAHAHRNRVNYTPIKADEVLLPALLQQAGYRTGLVGKLHLYYRYPPTSAEAGRIGFDRVEMHDGVRFTDRWSDYVTWRNARDPLKQIHYRALAAEVPKLAGRLPAGTNPFRAAIDEEFTDTTWTGQRARAFLRDFAGRDDPFFLFASFWKPHSPFEVPKPFDSLYNDIDIPLPKPETLEEIRRLPPPLVKLILRGSSPPYDMDRRRLEWIYRSYYGAITHIDREVGLILATLAETGQENETIVVFCSDHGDQLLEHGLMGKNVFFEASTRVPLVMRYPPRIKPQQYDNLVETIDVLPTLLDLAGVPQPYHCHGRSLVPLVGDARQGWQNREAVFSENIIPEIITAGSMDFQFEKGKGVKGIRHPDAKMVRTERWKYNYYPEGFAELYDLANDPLEQRNLAGEPEHRPIESEMKERILDWLITSTETDQIAQKWMLP